MVSRESYVFYKSFYESIDSLPTKEMQADAYKALMEYGFFGREPSSDNIGYTMWLAFRKQMDVNQKRYENSKKGGRPKKASNADANASKSIQKDANADNEEPVEIVTDESHRVPYQDVVNMYHEICVSLPTVRAVSDSRRKLIRSRYNQYGIDEIRTVFEKAEASDFLTGRSENSWRCGFDWLLNPSNFLKVLEGNYDNKNNKSQVKNTAAEELNDFYNMTAEWAKEMEGRGTDGF